MSEQDPAVRTWQSAIEAQLSTSASGRRLEEQLDRLRQDYNAELAARVAAERERDALAIRAADLEQVREELRQKALQHEGCLDDYQQWESEKADFVERSLALKAENERLRSQVDLLERTDPMPPWIVARDGGRYCERCEGEIRRGEAYELEPGTGGLMHHILCPDKEVTDG